MSATKVIEGIFAIATIAATVYLVANGQKVPVYTDHDRFRDEFNEMNNRAQFMRGATQALVRSELRTIRLRYESGRYSIQRCLSDLHFLKSMYF